MKTTKHEIVEAVRIPDTDLILEKGDNLEFVEEENVPLNVSDENVHYVKLSKSVRVDDFLFEVGDVLKLSAVKDTITKLKPSTFITNKPVVVDDETILPNTTIEVLAQDKIDNMYKVFEAKNRISHKGVAGAYDDFLKRLKGN